MGLSHRQWLPGDGMPIYKLGWQRRNRAQRLLQRLCIDCGDPAKARHVRCDPCLVKDKTRQARRGKRNIVKGLCRQCGRSNPDAGFYTRCHRCENSELRLFRKIRAGA